MRYSRFIPGQGRTEGIRHRRAGAERARRDDAAWLFLAVFLGLIAMRLFLLGYPAGRAWDIFRHQALNGTLGALLCLAPRVSPENFRRPENRHN
jgi:hypothetical protein